MLPKSFTWLALIYISGFNYYCEGTFIAIAGGTAAVGGAAAVGAAALAYKKLLEIKTSNIFFKLWTRDNLDAEIQVLNQKGIPRFVNFSPSRKTIILIHGGADTNVKGYAADYFQTLASAFLQAGDYNVIGVDWVRLTFPKIQILSIRNAFFVGKHTSLFLLILTKLKTKVGAGFDIVAHHYGNIAATVIGKLVRGSVINRITGLAPQNVGFGILPFFKYLSKNTAPVVDVIHTYGYDDDNVHHDIYINGGKGMQPDCFEQTRDCSIRKAYQYYAVDVYRNGTFYRATKCSSYENYLSGDCDGEPKISLYNHETPNSKLLGRYYLQTKEVSYNDLKELHIVTQKF